MEVAQYKMLCKDCKATAWCKQAFGKYWVDKSHGEIGCNSPMPQDGRYSPTITAPTHRPPPVRRVQGELKLINLVDKFRKAQTK